MIKKYVSFCLILFFFSSATSLAAKKVLIDTDPGVDDAQAVVFAFASPDLEVVGLTTIFGNVATPLATQNALRLLDIVGADVPVAKGAIKPIYSTRLPIPDFVHGKDGFGEINLPLSNRRAIDETAAEFIVRTVMDNPGEITLVVLGPMTNIALALALEPEIAQNVKQVVAMGGVLQVMGNVSPVASANILGDAHAADIVLGTDWDVVLVPGDTTRQVRVTDEWLERISRRGGEQGEFIRDASRFYRDFYRAGGVVDGFYNHDPTAVAYVVDPTLFKTEDRAIRVVTDGITIGDVVAATERHYSEPGAWFGIPLATITTEVDSDGVMQLIEDAIVGQQRR
jgi:inosine-uridine nucleoside N-ribohydrolase|tara:strand:+ start:3585 stop:4604 length:1020 start_codon:yes stop_codon:yes gene_type:complete